MRLSLGLGCGLLDHWLRQVVVLVEPPVASAVARLWGHSRVACKPQRKEATLVQMTCAAVGSCLPPACFIRRYVAGVDVVFDPVGGKQFNDAMKSVAWGAQYLIIGFASGSIPQVR